MPDDLAPIAPKLGRFLRMLTSNHDGEVLAAVQAMQRMLQSEQLDMHALAEMVESATGIKKFSEADALEIYQRGVQKGRDEAEAEKGFCSVDHDDPSWHDIAREM
jgi:hypothetical protein